MNTDHDSAHIDYILRGINDVDWDSLYPVSRPEDEVPALLRQLLSQDADVRNGAVVFLFGSLIVHQGTLSHHARHIIPFLLQMLDDEYTPDKELVLFGLESIATGRSGLSGDQTWRRDEYEKQGVSFQEAVQRAFHDAEQVREAAKLGLSRYLDVQDS